MQYNGHWSIMALLTSITTSVSTVMLSCGADSITELYVHDDGPWLTWSSDPATSVTITWLTKTPSSTSVRYGRAPADLAVHVEKPESSHLHRVRLQGLEPDTRYYYSLEETLGTLAAVQARSFRTAPRQSRLVRFGVVGDMQPQSAGDLRAHRSMLEHLASVSVDFWVQLGDVVSDGGERESWHRVLQSLPVVAGSTPFLFTAGNHDTAGDGGRNFRQVFDVGADDGSGPMYRSVDVLDMRLVLLDSYDGGGVPSEGQVRWLDDELRRARCDGKWVFVFMHGSLISTGTQNMLFEQQRLLVPLLDRYQVDAVFYGHDHMYEHYVYKYGTNGLLHDPGHQWEHAPVHYFLSGGGGGQTRAGLWYPRSQGGSGPSSVVRPGPGGVAEYRLVEGTLAAHAHGAVGTRGIAG